MMMHTEVERELTLLNPGTIADVFTRRHHNAPKKAAHDPMGIPQDPKQCVHVEYEEVSEGSYAKRCLDNASLLSPNGWLCAYHSNVLDNAVRLRSRASNRDRDAETITSILTIEAQALDASHARHLVRLTRNTWIAYLG